MDATPFYSDGMLVVAWTVFLLVMLFLLGSCVGSFLNVCIVRLPQGRSLMHPGSCCGNCHKPIRIKDNLPLLSYWLLRGRCRACGAPFSMRYFWIELLTGLVFVLIYHLEIGWNVHHLDLWHGSGYEYLEAGNFPPYSWSLFIIHAVLACFLIVATMTNREQHQVPHSVTYLGVLSGLVAALLCPWPWPNLPAQAVTGPTDGGPIFGRVNKPYVWGPHVGAMPADSPWWQGDVTPQAGLYPWPVWGPLPDGLPPGGWRLGAMSGLAGVLTGAILMVLVRLLFNTGSGATVVGWGETSLMMIAGAFLGWQPVVVAVLVGLVPGLIAAGVQRVVRRRSQVTFSLWMALAVAAVCLGWYWIGPLVQGLFFHASRLLLLTVGYGVGLVTFALCLRAFATFRRDAPRSVAVPRSAARRG